MARRSSYGFAVGDDDFDIVRLSALRQFEVMLSSGVIVPVQAHTHDAISEGTGHLNFVTVTETGLYHIRVFNRNEWRYVQETTPIERQKLFLRDKAEALKIHNARLANPQQQVS